MRWTAALCLMAGCLGFCAAGLAQGSGKSTGQVSTHTSLTAEAREIAGHTVATLTASVEAEDGAHAGGVVTLMEGSRSLAAAALDKDGEAVLRLDSLAEGDHTLSAVFSGDGLRAGSRSESLVVHPEATATPDFSVSIAPASLTMAAGASGTSVMTITPLNGFTGFLSLSCSGLPIDEIDCTFTPLNVQVVSASTPVTASLGVTTLGPGGKSAARLNSRSTPGGPLAWAILLPGISGLGFLGRRRNLLGRVALLALVGVVGVAGMTACAQRYRYLNHGPTVDGTPTGSYTLTVTAQTSNGVTATEHSTTLAVTVK